MELQVEGAKRAKLQGYQVPQRVLQWLGGGLRLNEVAVCSPRELEMKGEILVPFLSPTRPQLSTYLKQFLPCYPKGDSLC